MFTPVGNTATPTTPTAPTNHSALPGSSNFTHPALKSAEVIRQMDEWLAEFKPQTDRIRASLPPELHRDTVALDNSNLPYCLTIQTYKKLTGKWPDGHPYTSYCYPARPTSTIHLDAETLDLLTDALDDPGNPLTREEYLKMRYIGKLKRPPKDDQGEPPVIYDNSDSMAHRNTFTWSFASSDLNPDKVLCLCLPCSK